MMKKSYPLVWRLCLSIFMSTSFVCMADDSETLATRLWTAQFEQLPEIRADLAELPLERFPFLFAAIYGVPQCNDEGAPMLVGTVLKVYVERVGQTNSTDRVLAIVRSPDAPSALKRDLLRDVQHWTSSEDLESIINKLDGIGKPGEDVWLYAQYGASKLLRAGYSQSKRKPEVAPNLAKVEDISGARSKVIMRDLLTHYSDDTNLEPWTAKIIANYRRITPQEVDAALVSEFSRGNMGVSKQLAILDLFCGGGGSQSEGVATYVKRMMDEAVQQGKPLAGSDAEMAERLLLLHGQR